MCCIVSLRMQIQIEENPSYDHWGLQNSSTGLPAMMVFFQGHVKLRTFKLRTQLEIESVFQCEEEKNLKMETAFICILPASRLMDLVSRQRPGLTQYHPLPALASASHDRSSFCSPGSPLYNVNNCAFTVFPSYFVKSSVSPVSAQLFLELLVEQCSLVHQLWHRPEGYKNADYQAHPRTP